MKRFQILLLLLIFFYGFSGFAQNYWEFCGIDQNRTGHIFPGPSEVIYGTTQIGVAGNAGLYFSTDNGNNWSQLQLFTDVTSVVFNDSGYLFVATPEGVFRSTYYGGDWTNVGLTDLLNKRMAIGSNGCIFAGYLPFSGNGTVFKSTDNGNTWINTYLSARIRSIACSSNGNVYAATETGMFKSTNDGGNWLPINTNLTNTNVYTVFINSDDVIFIGTSDGGVFQSLDNGNTWLDISINSTSKIASIVTNSVGHVFAGEGNLFASIGIYRSTDNGNTWEPFNYGLNYKCILDLIVNSNDIIFAGLQDYGIYRTHYPTPVELDSFTGFAQEDKVVLNWSTATETNNHGFEIQRSLNKLHWATVGYKEGYGTTTEEHKYQFTDNLHSINANKLYYRLKQVDLNGNFKYSDVIEVGIAPQKFELYQNYPNPFNPTTNIKFAIPHLGYVTLKVYDVLGNEIKILVNEEKPSGRYNIKFNGSNLASGIYFYKLIAGDFVSTRKMVLLR